MAHFSLKLKLFVLVTVVYAGVGSLGGVLLEFIISKDYFGIYPTISIFYWIMGLVLTFGLNRLRKTNPDRLLHYFMTVKAAKFVLTILFLMLYVAYNPEVKMQFSVTLMCNYFIYSFLEMYIYFLYNKKIIQAQDKEKNETK
ncbi:hypothetical protein [Parabacteroides sp. PF5-9]|uniref:hypothetical protein n=1 Tax=Parabacteroides sp. PF5-9 TaxID=1742404 RepID=UPI0024769374|nr:hypothetical protein [Parabacteroides sp. PF5-9]MDH6358018.1 cbb3-type cytochrome oxidase subunit 3 [Parabacteroides sp. PF5-9]